jgi:hypothetical protein
MIRGEIALTQSEGLLSSLGLISTQPGSCHPSRSDVSSTAGPTVHLRPSGHRGVAARMISPVRKQGRSDGPRIVWPPGVHRQRLFSTSTPFENDESCSWNALIWSVDGSWNGMTTPIDTPGLSVLIVVPNVFV